MAARRVALWGLCGGISGYGLPRDFTICGWILTGLPQGVDGFDLAGTPACLQAAFPLGPDEPNVVIGCLVEEHEACATYCDKRVDCSVPGVSPAACPLTRNCGHATAPQATDAAIACVRRTELGKCFAQ